MANEQYTNPQQRDNESPQQRAGAPAPGGNAIKDPKDWVTGDEPIIGPNARISIRWQARRMNNRLGTSPKQKHPKRSRNCSERPAADKKRNNGVYLWTMNRFTIRTMSP